MSEIDNLSAVEDRDVTARSNLDVPIRLRRAMLDGDTAVARRILP